MTDHDASYRIIDEPAPSGGRRVAVDPFWPLISLVLTGILPGVLWFLYNGWALGSATFRRQVVVATIGVAGALACALGLETARTSIPTTALPYFGLALVAWKVMIGYVLHGHQAHSLELYEYFGGRIGKGILRLLLVIALAVVFGTLAHNLSPILGALFGERFFLS